MGTVAYPLLAVKNSRWPSAHRMHDGGGVAMRLQRTVDAA
jgi:hypothetical protein